MPFLCPSCADPASLGVTSAIELAPDSRWDEIALQLISCRRCSFKGLALYQESRRGPIDSEYVNHTGYFVSPNDIERVKIAIEQCPHPKDGRCGCYSHRSLGRQDKSSRCIGLDSIFMDKPFEMELYRGQGKTPPDSDLPDNLP